MALHWLLFVEIKMKVNATKTEPVFIPKTIAITFETYDEWKAFQTLTGFHIAIPARLAEMTSSGSNPVTPEQKAALSNTMSAICSTMIKMESRE